MSAPVSHKLVQGRSGNFYVVSGNPDIGYTVASTDLDEMGRCKRSWQAVQAAQQGYIEEEWRA